MTAIQVRGLRHGLAGVPVLDGIDLDVAPGEFVALVGPSGCGKSTLLTILAGLMDADAGTVRIGDGDGGDRLGRLTLMPQRDALLPWRTVRENVALGAALGGHGRDEAREVAQRTLERYGLAGFEDHYPHGLSGGMRQRAALARTVLGNAGAWLLDEPLGALDALTRADLQRVLAEAWSRSGATTLLVTHDLDEALLLADRVLVCGPRPARIVAEIPVGLPRPRDLGDTVAPAFTALRARLMEALRASGALA